MADLPSPWREFLTELDDALSGPVGVHCIGGFVVSLFYGLPRPTGDIDYYTATLNLDGFAGPGSHLAKKYKVFFHRVTVIDLPVDYQTRLVEMFPDQFKKLHLFAPDAYDLILSKVERNSSKDRDDVAYLFQTQKLDPKILEERYQTELRPYLLAPENGDDLTIKLWLEMFKAGGKE